MHQHCAYTLIRFHSVESVSVIFFFLHFIVLLAGGVLSGKEHPSPESNSVSLNSLVWSFQGKGKTKVINEFRLIYFNNPQVAWSKSTGPICHFPLQVTSSHTGHKVATFNVDSHFKWVTFYWVPCHKIRFNFGNRKIGFTLGHLLN